MLVTELLKKMQFRHNETQLRELDDESVDDDVRNIDTEFSYSLASQAAFYDKMTLNEWNIFHMNL